MRPEATHGHFVPCRLQESPPLPFSYQANDSVSAGLAALFRAYQYSLHARTDRWRFALEIEDLLCLGLTKSDLRWLISAGIALHARRVIGPKNKSWQLVDAGLQPFSGSSCLVLSDKGIKLLSQQATGKSRKSIAVIFAANKGVPSDQTASNSSLLPQWNLERRELRLGGMLVKQFRGPAANQERIIRAFHEERWPVRIDDPLPQAAGQDPRRRLNDAIKNLNRHQRHQLIYFRGDGTGKGVLWEMREAPLDAPVNRVLACDIRGM